MHAIACDSAKAAGWPLLLRNMAARRVPIRATSPVPIRATSPVPILRADRPTVPVLNAAMPADPTTVPVRVSLRLELASGGRIGPGKVALLEAIGQAGSISGAARLLGMSYPRAWNLVEALDLALEVPLVSRAPGGARGGGAVLTEAGKALIARYRGLEASAQQLAGPPPGKAPAT